jgi:hypothetical protein
MKLAMLIKREAGFSGNWMPTMIILSGTRKFGDLPFLDVPVAAIDNKIPKLGIL